MIFLIIFSLIVLFVWFCWGFSWLLNLCLKWQLKVKEERNAELIRICTESDVVKLTSLLKKGLDPNTKVKRTHEVYASDDDYDFHPDIETVYEPLIEVASDKRIKDLLIAYGAITRGDFKAE